MNIVLAVQEGRGMDFLKQPTYIWANFNGRIMESEPCDPKPSPIFGTELVWESEKKDLRKVRSINSPLRVECFSGDTGQKKYSIGFVLLSLRSAPVIPSRVPELDIPFKWYKLLSVPPEYKNFHPELYLSLTIRDHMSYKELPPAIPYLPELAPSSETIMDREIIPIRFLQDGYIQIGEENVACDSYTLTITVKNAFNLHVLLPEDLVFKQATGKYYLSFVIFGLTLKSKPFYKDLHEEIPLNEKICIRLMSNYEILKVFFEQYYDAVICFYNGNDKLGVSKIKLKNLVPQDDFYDKVVYEENCVFLTTNPDSEDCQEIKPYVQVECILDLKRVKKDEEVGCGEFGLLRSAEESSTSSISAKEGYGDQLSNEGEKKLPVTKKMGNRTKSMQSFMPIIDENEEEFLSKSTPVLKNVGKTGENVLGSKSGSVKDLEVSERHHDNYGKYEGCDDERKVEMYKDELKIGRIEEEGNNGRSEEGQRRFEEQQRFEDQQRFEEKQRFEEQQRFEEKQRFGENQRFEEKQRSEENQRFEEQQRFKDQQRFEEQQRTQEFYDAQGDIGQCYPNQDKLKKIFNEPSKNYLESYKQYSLFIMLENIIWRHPMAHETFEVHFFHPTASTNITLVTEVDTMPMRKHIIENVRCKLYFIAQPNDIKSMVKTYLPRITFTDSSNHRLFEDLVFKNFPKGDLKEISLVSSLFSAENNEHKGDVTVSMFLDELSLGVRKNYAAFDLLPPILDESIVLACLEDFEKWKEDRMKKYNEELKVMEKKHIQEISKDWMKRKNELENKLIKSVEKCKNLSAELQRNKLKQQLAMSEERRLGFGCLEGGLRGVQRLEGIQRMEGIQRIESTQKINDQHQEHQKEYYSNFNTDFLRDFQRDFLKDPEHCISPSYYDAEVEDLKKENDHLKSMVDMHKEEINRIKTISLTNEQTTSLIQEVRALQEKCEDAQKSKVYFKEQWTKAVKEIHDLKIEKHKLIQNQIEAHKEELKSLKLEEVASPIVSPTLSTPNMEEWKSFDKASTASIPFI